MAKRTDNSLINCQDCGIKLKLPTRAKRCPSCFQKEHLREGKQRYHADPEKARERTRESNRRLIEKNPEYYRQYKENNLEKIKENHDRFRKNNPEKLKEWGRQYSKKNPEKGRL